MSSDNLHYFTLDHLIERKNLPFFIMEGISKLANAAKIIKSENLYQFTLR